MSKTTQDRHPRILIANFLLYAAAFLCSASYLGTVAATIAALTFIGFVIMPFVSSTITFAVVNRRR